MTETPDDGDLRGKVGRVITPWRDGGWKDRVAGQLAWWLPRRVVYFALIRGWAYATTGRYGSTIAPEVTADEVLRRWERRPDQPPEGRAT
jgi:hypothetical protein